MAVNGKNSPVRMGKKTMSEKSKDCDGNDVPLISPMTTVSSHDVPVCTVGRCVSQVKGGLHLENEFFRWYEAPLAGKTTRLSRVGVLSKRRAETELNVLRKVWCSSRHVVTAASSLRRRRLKVNGGGRIVESIDWRERKKGLGRVYAPGRLRE
jgi:hypothetical protein